MIAIDPVVGGTLPLVSDRGLPVYPIYITTRRRVVGRLRFYEDYHRRQPPSYSMASRQPLTAWRTRNASMSGTSMRSATFVGSSGFTNVRMLVTPAVRIYPLTVGESAVHLAFRDVRGVR